MKTPSRPVLAALAATSLFAIPAASQASPYEAALNACVKAFMSTNFADKEPLKVYSDSPAGSLMPQYSRLYSFTLTATGNGTGKRLAQSVCTADRSGSVSIEPME